MLEPVQRVPRYQLLLKGYFALHFNFLLLLRNVESEQSIGITLTGHFAPFIGYFSQDLSDFCSHFGLFRPTYWSIQQTYWSMSPLCWSVGPHIGWPPHGVGQFAPPSAMYEKKFWVEFQMRKRVWEWHATSVLSSRDWCLWLDAYFWNVNLLKTALPSLAAKRRCCLKSSSYTHVKFTHFSCRLSFEASRRFRGLKEYFRYFLRFVQFLWLCFFFF